VIRKQVEGKEGAGRGERGGEMRGGKGGEGRGEMGVGGVPPVDYTVEADTPAHPHHEGQLARKMDGSVVYLFQFSAVSKD
jgi:hypothetical protein